MTLKSTSKFECSFKHQQIQALWCSTWYNVVSVGWWNCKESWWIPVLTDTNLPLFVKACHAISNSVYYDISILRWEFSLMKINHTNWLKTQITHKLLNQKSLQISSYY